MQKKTVYIAGKITGDPFYRSKFYEAQKKPFFFFNDWEAKQNAEK